jgi:hypothetical protein
MACKAVKDSGVLISDASPVMTLCRTTGSVTEPLPIGFADCQYNLAGQVNWIPWPSQEPILPIHN